MAWNFSQLPLLADTMDPHAFNEYYHFVFREMMMGLWVFIMVTIGTAFFTIYRYYSGPDLRKLATQPRLK